MKSLCLLAIFISCGFSSDALRGNYTGIISALIKNDMPLLRNMLSEIDVYRYINDKRLWVEQEDPEFKLVKIDDVDSSFKDIPMNIAPIYKDARASIEWKSGKWTYKIEMIESRNKPNIKTMIIFEKSAKPNR